MATVPAVTIQWIPEDDLLLKNAVEAGASLEALAKGAVQFSRRYTLQELEKRWSSLLYDPDISSQAAARIFELEISGVNSAPKLNRFDNNFTEASKKRKSESIRRKYHAMRKQIHNDMFNSRDLGFFEPNPHEFNCQDGNSLGQNCLMGDDLSDHLGFQEEDLAILRHTLPDTIMDIAVSSCATDASQIVRPNSMEENFINENPHNSSVVYEGREQFDSSNSGAFPSLETAVFVPTQAHFHHINAMHMVHNDIEGKENNSAAYSGEFGDPDSLLNLSNEDGIVLVDDIDSVTKDSNQDCKRNEVPESEPETVAALEVNPPSKAKATSNSDILVACEGAASSDHGDQQINRQTEVDLPSKSNSCFDIPRLSNGTICCVLNTEDTEIPCNDDIFLLIHPSTSFDSTAEQPNPTTSMDSSPCDKSCEDALCFPAKAKDSLGHHIMGSNSLTESRSHPFVGHAAKTESLNSRSQASRLGFVNKTIGNSSTDRSLYALPNVSGNILFKKEVTGVNMKARNNSTGVTEMIQSTEADSRTSQFPESVEDFSVSEPEESDLDDNVPYFSDVEAMILEMDLDSNDQDYPFIKQVPSYQYDDTKRTIIRLEQGARSSLQRAMTSQGALAILYGHHLRQYIKKPEVLLGRSTDDVDVDIDLRKEGRANKISRRQAIIKMEADGSFVLKNLGKSSISVNGNLVGCGQLLTLGSNCLIEIKGMSFVFEINEGYVKKQLSEFSLKNKGKSGK